MEQLLKHKPILTLLQNGETALHAAALFGHMKVIKLLLSYGVDIALKNKVSYMVSNYILHAVLKFLLQVK